MSLRLDVEQIKTLMNAFYTLTGIRFVLFDTDFHEVISYPQENCRFCQLMKSNSKTRRKCSYADRHSFQKCEQTNALLLYNCHAGLVEAIMPLHENEKIVGYLMFGQITDLPDKTALLEKIPMWSQKYGIDKAQLQKSISEITYKTPDEIQAAAKIMEACTSYIIYKELITPESNRILEAAKAYIEAHLSEDIKIEKLCSDLDVGRTKLYEIFRNELKIGISKYILRRRLHKAKKLLKTTELTIPEIASSVGFMDYNYFSRVYKTRYGKAPKSYRK